MPARPRPPQLRRGCQPHRQHRDQTFTIDKADSTTEVTCSAGPFVYTGSAQTPCSASVTGAGGLNLSPTPNYSDNDDAGTATASCQLSGGCQPHRQQRPQNFTIDKASSSTDVTCTAGPNVYTGSALTPCTASATGAGGLNPAPDAATYTNNAGVGTATASYYTGDTNHFGTIAAQNFTIDKAPSSTTVSCPTSVTYTGSALTPCTANVTGDGGLNQSLTGVSYADNTNAGTATASASYAGDANHFGSSDSANFTISFNFTGFASPVDNNNVLNTAKAGQAIPLKWRLTDASGNPVTNLLITDVKVSVANYSFAVSLPRQTCSRSMRPARGTPEPG